jgi:hypothetical protein
MTIHKSVLNRRIYTTQHGLQLESNIRRDSLTFNHDIYMNDAKKKRVEESLGMSSTTFHFGLVHPLLAHDRSQTPGLLV